MEFDLTITMSVIIGLVATLPQIIVAIINNIYQLKIKKIELYELQKRDTLQIFINSAIECYKNDNDWRKNKEFMKNLYVMQIYFKSANTKFIQALDTLMNNKTNDNDFNLQFAKVVNKLSEEIKKK